jgi:hypothetical protein
LPLRLILGSCPARLLRMSTEIRIGVPGPRLKVVGSAEPVDNGGHCISALSRVTIGFGERVV